MFNTATSHNHKLHIPVGIRFECTRCANCCLSWPVPLTEKDVKRLTDELQCGESDLPVSLLSAAERQAGLAGFTKALEKRPDGRCSYLSEFACTLQDRAKPAMCQLFPYSFIDTPDGTYVGLSFASTGVLHNSGRLLQEQNKELAEVLDLFRELFPTLQEETTSAFENLKLAEGIALSFDQFKSLEAPLLEEFEQAFLSPTRTALEILGSFSKAIAQLVPKDHWRSRLPGTGARPRQIDFYILDALAQAYIDPDSKLLLLDEMQIALAVSANLMAPPPGFKLKLLHSSYSAVQFLETKLGAFDRAGEDLLLRFLYVRIFSKMYFGPGFSGLSLIAGVGHLTALVVLVRLAAKARIMAGLSDFSEKNQQANLLWLVETIRQIDSKLTSARYGANSQAMLEILFLDPERVQRLIDLAA